MVFSQKINTHRIFKRLAKALIRLRVCAGWSEPLLVAHITLLEISCHGSFGRCDLLSSTTFGRKTMTWQFRPNVVPDCFFRPNVVLGEMSHRPKVVCDELSYRRNGFRRIVVHPIYSGLGNLGLSWKHAIIDYRVNGAIGDCPCKGKSI